MNYLLYLTGFLPSLIWLLFYLRRDAHPESNRMVLWIFFLGIIAGVLAAILESVFQIIFPSSSTEKELLGTAIAMFVGVGFIEEFSKYLMVRIGINQSPELDEPFDVLLYMIIAALGFAALENILILGSYHPFLTPSKAMSTMFWRFISATFLHALASALLGYFLAMSFLHTKKRGLLLFTGIALASILHGLYDFYIINIERAEQLILPSLMLILLACFVSISIKKLKRLKSVCLIDN